MSIRHPRILLYSHDSYGLGHLRRTLAIAGQLACDLPHASQVLITGSMVAGAFTLPPHLDLIKLPALTKRSDGRYKARAMPLSLAQITAWREQMILQTALAFQPDLVLVDKTPAGVQNELLPTLRHLKTWRPETRLVLGMRDIEDDPATTRLEWEACDARRLQEEVYDRLLLYGQREVFDPVREYAMSPTAAAKLVPCGYLGGVTPTRSREAVRRELDADGRPLIVVTVGGGGDGFDLPKTYLEALAAHALCDAHSLIVTGPLMARKKRELLQSAARAEHLTLLEFTPDLISYLAAADLVISMAGYNTVREALALGARLLLVPRVRPRAEQRLRAERLAKRGLARVLLPHHLSPVRLAAEIEAALASPLPDVTLDFNGLTRVSHAIVELLETKPPSPPCAAPGNGHKQIAPLFRGREIAGEL
jgi:predicted glycosyltransferase